MKRVWLVAALAPLSFAAATVAAPAHADTTISNGTSTPLPTSSAGNVTIQSGGSITLTSSGAAVTINSNNTVSNAGSITFNNVSGAEGVYANTSAGAITSSITNTGTITVSEKTTGDSTHQTYTTGPFANGSDRFGIEITGSGVFNGSITDSGTITIVGENSAGIEIESELNGSLLTVDSSISVTGGTPTYSGTAVANSGDISYGINAPGLITGSVSVGNVSATGQNAVGVALTGGVSGPSNGLGGIVFEGAVTVTGYRLTTAPTDPTALAKLNPDQELQGGPDAEIAGAIPGGVFISEAVTAVANISSGNPEGVLTEYGAAPAVLIGGVNATTIGPDGNNFSFDDSGSIVANGTFPDVGAIGVQVGGTNPLPVASGGVGSDGAFANVSLPNGIFVSGALDVWSEEHTPGAADSTALLIGSGATVGGAANSTGLTVTGSLSATSESDASLPLGSDSPGTAENSIFGNSTQVPITVTGVKVEAGGSLTSIVNAGLISATITGIPTAPNYNAAGGVQGQAIAIDDESGTVTQVTNTDAIIAGISPIVPGQTVQTANSDVVAIYLANTNANVTVTQSPNGNTSITPTMVGSVIFGNLTVAGNTSTAGTITGSESLDLEAGSLSGNVVFSGAGSNSLTINNGAVLVGGLAQAADGTLAINVEDGELDMVAPTANTMGGAPASINVSSLSVGSKGDIVFAVDPSRAPPANGQFDVAGAATLAANATIGISLLTKVATATSPTFTLIHAGSLVTSGINGELLSEVPYLYQGVVSITPTDLDVTLTQKSAAALGMNPAQAAAYDAIYSQMSTDSGVVASVLSQYTRSGFLNVYNQFLPDYEGGVFESLAQTQRDIAQAEADPPVRLQTDETRGWVQEIGVLENRQTSAVANGYQAQGIGIAGGVESAHGDTAIGVTGAFISTGVQDSTQPGDASLSAVVIEGGAYWRKAGTGLNVSASVNGGYVALGSHRLMVTQTDAGAVTLLRDAESQWSGALASAQFSVGYQMSIGRFFIKPEVSADYIALFESAHDEREGGPAMDLAINSRTSSEASAEGDLVMGWTFGTAMQYRPQLTVGYREIVYGGPAATTARFLSGASDFTLNPDLSDRGGLLARLGLRASGAYADITADAGGEFRDGYQSYDARAVARFLF